MWCNNNHLGLNFSDTTELVVKYSALNKYVMTGKKCGSFTHSVISRHVNTPYSLKMGCQSVVVPANHFQPNVKYCKTQSVVTFKLTSHIIL